MSSYGVRSGDPAKQFHINYTEFKGDVEKQLAGILARLAKLEDYVQDSDKDLSDFRNELYELEKLVKKPKVDSVTITPDPGTSPYPPDGIYDEKERRYITGTGQSLWNIHDRSMCEGRGSRGNCVIHNPSFHAVRSFPTHWRGDRQLMERICPHGIGHPDPDHISFTLLLKGGKAAGVEAVHGCDGCCLSPEAREAMGYTQ